MTNTAVKVNSISAIHAFDPVKLDDSPPMPESILKEYTEGWASPVNDSTYRSLRQLAQEHWQLVCTVKP